MKIITVCGMGIGTSVLLKMNAEKALRALDIDADVTLNGDDIGKVEIDPVVAGISYVMKF